MVMSVVGLEPKNNCWHSPAAIVNYRPSLFSEKVPHVTKPAAVREK
jgi:hypothetical protein